MVATGVRSGEILLWDCHTSSVRKVIHAHDLGPPLPSVLNGQPISQGVGVMVLNNGMTQLVTGGADGRVMKWNIPDDARGQLENGLELASVIELSEPLESTPVVFRGLDCSPLGGPEILVGTHRWVSDSNVGFDHSTLQLQTDISVKANNKHNFKSTDCLRGCQYIATQTVKIVHKLYILF